MFLMYFELEDVVEQRISLVTLGCQNVETQTKFYENLGWRRVKTQGGIVAFDLLSQVLGLYPIAALAEDLGVDEGQLKRARVDPNEPRYAAITLGYNTRDGAEVDHVIAAAKAAGATIVKEPAEVFWGGYHGYFADPEGHLWEVAHNPFSALSPEGAFCWNGHQNG
jgi:hypothetical protein|tara:strand:- start:596 stop:1093 length:498 start_codon:yes stop_codon:yes gene_type:complete